MYEARTRMPTLCATVHCRSSTQQQLVRTSEQYLGKSFAICKSASITVHSSSLFIMRYLSMKVIPLSCQSNDNSDDCILQCRPLLLVSLWNLRV